MMFSGYKNSAYKCRSVATWVRITDIVMCCNLERFLTLVTLRAAVDRLCLAAALHCSSAYVHRPEGSMQTHGCHRRDARGQMESGQRCSWCHQSHPTACSTAARCCGRQQARASWDTAATLHFIEDTAALCQGHSSSAGARTACPGATDGPVQS